MTLRTLALALASAALLAALPVLTSVTPIDAWWPLSRGVLGEAAG
jgi:hypothetical protein